MDVMHQIISAEQMLSGCFEPVNSDNLEVNCEVSNVTEIDEVLRAKKYLILALSDADNYTDQQVKKYNADCCDAFEKYFPQKSSFEID